MNNDEFRELGHRFIDWVADYREGIRDLSVMSPAKPSEIRVSIGAEDTERKDVEALWAQMRDVTERV